MLNIGFRTPDPDASALEFCEGLDFADGWWARTKRSVVARGIFEDVEWDEQVQRGSDTDEDKLEKKLSD